jgi:hypothetical protein
MLLLALTILVHQAGGPVVGLTALKRVTRSAERVLRVVLLVEKEMVNVYAAAFKPGGTKGLQVWRPIT